MQDAVEVSGLVPLAVDDAAGQLRQRRCDRGIKDCSEHHLVLLCLLREVASEAYDREAEGRDERAPGPWSSEGTSAHWRTQADSPRLRRAPRRDATRSMETRASATRLQADVSRGSIARPNPGSLSPTAAASSQRFAALASSAVAQLGARGRPTNAETSVSESVMRGSRAAASASVTPSEALTTVAAGGRRIATL